MSIVSFVIKVSRESCREFIDDDDGGGGGVLPELGGWIPSFLFITRIKSINV